MRLRVDAGQIATVLGSNGAGKTTILKTISGIIDPRRGSITFKGEAITAIDPSLIVRKGLPKVNPGLFERRLVSRAPDDLAILIYTSGTTGKPKGAMHSHRGLVLTVRGYNRTFVANPETVPENIREFAPTVALAVPRSRRTRCAGILPSACRCPRSGGRPNPAAL